MSSGAAAWSWKVSCRRSTAHTPVISSFVYMYVYARTTCRGKGVWWCMHQIKNYMSSTSQIGESGVDRNYHHTMTWDLVSHPCTLKGLASGFSLGAAPLPWNGFILACNVWACRKITSPNQNVFNVVMLHDVAFQPNNYSTWCPQAQPHDLGKFPAGHQPHIDL